MKLTISKTELLNALSIVKGTTSNKPILPIGEYAKLESKNGKLTFHTTDFQSSTIHIIDYSGDDFVMLLPVNWFIEFLKELAEQPITITLNELVLKITTVLNGEYEIPTEDAKDFSKPKKCGEVKFTTSASDLKAALFAVSDNDLMPQFTGVAISDKTIRASNSHILYSHSHSGYTGDAVMFPKKVLSLLPDGDYGVSISKNEVCFSTEDTQYYTTLVDAVLPPYDAVIPDTTPIQFSVDRLQLLSALKRLKLFANQVKQSVRFEFTSDGLMLSATDVDLAKVGKERVNGELIGEPITIAFNGIYMQAVLGAMLADMVYINLTSHSRAAVIRETNVTDDKESLMLIMPCVL